MAESMHQKINVVLSSLTFLLLLAGYLTDYWLSVGTLDIHSGLHKACFFGICIKIKTISDSLDEDDDKTWTIENLGPGELDDKTYGALMEVAQYSGGAAVGCCGFAAVLLIWDFCQRDKGKCLPCLGAFFLSVGDILTGACLAAFLIANSIHLEYLSWSFYLVVASAAINPWISACCECGGRKTNRNRGRVMNEPV